ncbi:hypothetical protein [Pseudoalteromonas sp. BDTF-M6]|uniref:hypothetical protein n=1 Tax=Pseudoalteromonas sp. BDTF-M6 TaxID=2796132 RepID=UPI001BAF2406|nr:hypothetical protein [Pseudoalteromonas sp. BDTF-M6]MBS3797899.1 hypothetical protein [Pseudoalteromonas sp. BDTF-M6]
MTQFRSPLAVFSLRNDNALADFDSLTQQPVLLGAPEQLPQLLCRLPNNAQPGDCLHASVSFAEQRHAQLQAHYRVRERDLNSAIVALTLHPNTTSTQLEIQGQGLLQLSLHGRHEIIKESAQFSVYLHPQSRYEHLSPEPQSKSKARRLVDYCQRIWG